MAAVRRIWQLERARCVYLIQQRTISSSRVLLAANWNKDWKPGSYPKTEAERAAAAKKYGFLPEDYKPLPDDGDGHGDYPYLPTIGEDQKSPYLDYDNNAYQTNYGEPVHIDIEILEAGRGDPAEVYRIPPKQMWITLLCVLGFIAAVTVLTQPSGLLNARYCDWHPYDDLQNYKKGRRLPTMERNVHYTFEAAE